MTNTRLLSILLPLALGWGACQAEKTVMVDAMGNKIKAAMGDYSEMYRVCRCTTPQGDTKFCQCTTPQPDLTRVSEQGEEAQVCRRVLVPIERTTPAKRPPVLVNR